MNELSVFAVDVRAHERMDDRAVFAPQQDLLVIQGLAALQSLHHFPRFIRMNIKIRNIPADTVPAVVAQHFQLGTIGLENCPLLTQPMQTESSVFKEIIQLVLASTERLDRALAVGDVTEID